MVQGAVTLTEMEGRMMQAMRTNEYADCYSEECSTWTAAVITESRIPEVQARGVLSSLVQKGMLSVDTYEVGVTVVALTDAGRAYFAGRQ